VNFALLPILRLNNSNYFYSPTEVAQGKAPIDRSFRLGGMVAVGSFKREDLKSTFDVTDYPLIPFYFVF
jgi:cytochrome c-type biogenesis protein CcmE